MAKAITSKTESLTIRVPVDLMAEMRAAAKMTGASLGSVFVGRVRANTIIPIGPPASAIADDHVLVELGEANDIIERQAKEIAGLKKALAAQSANPVVQALRSDPANRIIDPKVHHVSGPVMAAAVPPVVGGNAVGFNLKGQTKGKGKP